MRASAKSRAGVADLGADRILTGVDALAIREAAEETGLAVTLCTLLGVYSDPARDPRGHTVTAVYVAEARGEPRAMDDARALQVFFPDALPPVLAFDHALVLADYRRWRAEGLPAPLRLDAERADGSD